MAIILACITRVAKRLQVFDCIRAAPRYRYNVIRRQAILCATTQASRAEKDQHCIPLFNGVSPVKSSASAMLLGAVLVGVALSPPPVVFQRPNLVSLVIISVLLTYFV